MDHKSADLEAPTGQKMSIEENKEIVRRFMQYFSEIGRLDEAYELLAEDITWSLWGNGPGAGRYDKAGMKALMLDSFRWFVGPLLWIPVGFTAEGDRVAVEAVSSGTTTSGHHHNGIYHNLCRVRDGKIIEIREMFLEGPVKALFESLRASSGIVLETIPK